MSETATTGPEPAAPRSETAPPGTVPAVFPGPAPGLVAGTAAPAGPMPRRARGAVGRWAAAVAVFGVLGSGVAYGISEQERTDVPGLATQHDGRWDYPRLTLPALPSGAPRPFSDGNLGEIHHADLRDLLLPAPRGAAADEELPGTDGGWVSIDTFTQVYADGDRAELRRLLTDDAVRHIAARGWTTPDGTRTAIYLLRFNSGAYAGDFYLHGVSAGLTPFVTPEGVGEATPDESWPEESAVPNVERYAFDEVKPRGEDHVRQAYLVAGDILAVVVQSRKGTAHAVPFQQAVILQSQLLG